MNRESNLQLDIASRGASVEFWLKKDEFITGLTEKEVIFDAWNGELSSSADYGRLRVEISGTADGLNPVYVTLYSGSTGFTQRVASPTFTTSSLADGNWHHYAVTLLAQSSSVLSRFYVDGQLNHQQTIVRTMGDINSSDLRANIGALVASPSGSSALPSAGKLSGSLDEFRYWKTHRSSEDIGLFWFSQVGGGVNTDPTPFVDTKETANIDLGVYYKFNEGITGVRATDATVLDYAGRLTNGAWTGYTSTSRNTGSAIVLSHAAIKEFKDPIIYSFHPAVKALESRMAQSGSAYDAGNNAAIYNSIPSWITEEDTEGEGELRKLTQIISSYFDTLQLQVESLNNLKDIEYVSGSNKPLPFAEKLLASNGLVAPELFIDADILEKLNDRSEDKLYEKSLEDIKNTIYQNIYNNLSYIYKSKGTAKSFRNLIRCFGIGEELVRINMYADNVEYELRNNRTEVITADKFVNFNTERNQYAAVYNYPDPSNANAVGFITSSTALTAGYALTLESEVVLPLKPDQAAEYYFDTNAISSSVFGVHGATDNPTDTVWSADDSVNFQVYTVRDELQSNNARFVLTSSTGGHIPLLSSELFEDIYNNTRWNLAVRIKPEKYPLENFVSGADSGNYIVELHGCQAEAGEILQEFTVSGTITSPPDAFMTGSRRVYVGAHRTNITGGLLQTSDVKVNSCRYWLDYVENEALRGHVLDTENFGAMQPHLYAYQFDPEATFGDITKMDTLVFNWEFLTNTGSNASGEFSVADISSGSQALTRFGQLGDILNKQYTAAGSNFEASSTSAIDKDFIVSSKLNLPEHIYSEDMVSVLNQQDQDVFVPDSRPIHYYFAFEKSMYQAISVEMLNYFANLKDLNNLIGDAVNQWRPEYKSLAFVRQKFFEKVSNSQLDFDKFYEFYKWFDSSLSVMLGQLVPASADFASNVRTVIESHILERSKYQRKFPFIVKEGALNIGGAEDSMPEWDSYQAPMMAPPRGPGGMQSAMHPTRRQIGTPAVVPQFSWDKVHPPVDGNKNKNLYWQRYLNKDVENTDAINDIHKAIKQTYMRRIGSPVNLGVEGSVVLGGVGKHPGTRPGYTFAATAPWGPVVPLTNIPTNVMLSFDTDVEELIDTPDVFNPSLKQRLGFGMDPSINIDGNRKGNGNTFAPFSLYSSSVTTGYNEPVQRLYKSGTMVTNLHNDFVGNTDIPMQGPFTEKYVGGRQYRHTPLNDGTDTRENRAEGFRVELGLLDTGSAIPIPASGSLGVVPPNYPFGDSPSGSAPHGFLPNIPIAPRLREEAAKRPVNIKNIQLRTGSTIIGNYEKNYQVVNTAGRIYNDPYFNDQSFDFSLFPETLATRGRFPLTPEIPVTTGQHKSFKFDGVDDYIEIGPLAYWTNAVTNGDVSVSFWMKPSSIAANDVVFCLGHLAEPHAKDYRAGLELKFFWDPASGGWVPYAQIMDTDGKTSYTYSDLSASSGIQTDTWYHVVITYGSGAPNIYLNGALQNVGGDTALATFTGPEDYPLTLGTRLGYGGNKYDGYLADFVVWDDILTADNVTELYNGGSYVNISTLSLAGSPYGWWPLGDDAGDTYLVLNTNINNPQGGIATPDGDGINTPPDAIQNVTPFPTTTVWTSSATPNPGGAPEFALPDRSGPNSNQTVIVNRFAGCGYEVMSRGYMDPAHEELSVYNALPYRDLSVIDYGLSGSASMDPSIQHSIRVIDQIEKNRGLDQRASLHCGPFGSDAAYGSVPALTYVTVPSWHKTNRNARKLMKSGSAPSTFVTGVVYDNLFVQHQIPRSEQQYSWITASLAEGETIFGLQGPSCFSASALTQIVSSSIGQDNDGNPIILNFVGINEYVYEPLSASSHILGYPLGTDLLDYRNTTLLPAGIAHTFNVLQLHRNGPYGYPTWKQIRTGEHPIARELRETNMIGQVVPPKSIPNIIGNKVIGYIHPDQPNTFVDYFEAPIMSQYSPVNFYLEDNTSRSNTANNVILSVPYGNELDWFNHDGLNNRLGLKIDLDEVSSYTSVLNYILAGKGSNLSMMANHSQRIYPAAVNVYNDIVRARTEFTIDDIWNDNRRERRVLGEGMSNSQGIDFSIYGPGTFTPSVWSLDAKTNYVAFLPTGTLPLVDTGELQNTYSRYYANAANEAYTVAAATYASRLLVSGPVGPPPYVYAGGAEWLAGAQAMKNPYQDYATYAERMRLVGKDHSVVPEFRISEHMETYVQANSGDFLADIDGIFELTGAAHSDSADSNFFTVYSNSDFMKYFKAIDEDLNDRRSGNLKIRRDKVSLKCDALIKFLPYKGFYPAERTLELASLFSQSYGPTLVMKTGSLSAGVPLNRERVMRTVLEPTYAPGIMYNTIKSGIAVSNWVLTNIQSGSDPTRYRVSSSYGAKTVVPEGTIRYETQVTLGRQFGPFATPSDGYGLTKLPFETIYEPAKYLTPAAITGSGWLYDTGVISGSDSLGDYPSGLPCVVKFNEGGKLYELAIDNFLCETVNFFDDSLVHLQSRREDEFTPVVSGSQYTMQLQLYRTMTQSGTAQVPDRSRFEMYNRASAFGAPIGSNVGDPLPAIAAAASSSFSVITPPYFEGQGSAHFTFTAPATEIPTLDTILSNLTIEYNRDDVGAPLPTRIQTGYNFSPEFVDSGPAMQIDSCFNLTDYIGSLPRGTVGIKKSWLIQSKFETPILNFAGVSSSSPPAFTTPAGITPPADLVSKGMWHQYGSIPTSSTDGVFAILQDSGSFDGLSLADVVGFDAGRSMRIGSVKKENLLEEAVVAVPFKVVRNRRKFFKARQRTNRNGTNTQFLRIKALMDKYVFPPKFDFTRHRTVDPILMYAFEFSAKLSQQDIADMWQNLPPSIGEKFEQKEVIIEEKEILNLLADNSEDIQWMVFKVKKRAKKSYEKYRRSLVTEDTSAFPDTIGEYSYNWPYDYFSLVELIKIEEGVQYSSSDMGQIIDISPEVVADPAPRRRDEPPPALNIPAGRDG